MNKLQVSLLLTFMSTVDNRKVLEPTVEAWHLAVGDLDYEEARSAVVVHWRTSTEYLLPAHVRRIVERLREDRDEQLRRDELHLEMKTEWCAAHGVTVAEYDEHAATNDVAWIHEVAERARSQEIDAASAEDSTSVRVRS